jgi:hypothetical protein
MEENKNLEQNLDNSNEKLHISDVIQTLNDFHEWSLTQEAMFDDRLIPNYIEYLKSFNVV